MNLKSAPAILCVVPAVVLGLCAAAGTQAPAPANAPAAPGTESVGNTDGVLTWRVGGVGSDAPARHVVLFAFDTTQEAAARRLAGARARFARPAPASPGSGAGGSPVWITNGTTDFALGTGCMFRWRLVRQALACAAGGQLSQFAWYVHWDDASGPHRAGTINDGDPETENLRVVEQVRAVSVREACGAVETTDGTLRIGVRAITGEAGQVAVEFMLSCAPGAAPRNVRLSAYANIEAAHTHEGDYSTLDAGTGALMVIDPPTGMTVLMGGPDRPESGYSGTWNSMVRAQTAEGVPFAQWQPYRGMPASLKERILGDSMAASGIYLPYTYKNPVTPETRDLTPAQAQDALRRDWLFQASGRPTAERVRQEIGWARTLAARIGSDRCAAELAELAALEGRLPLSAEATDLYLAVRAVKRRISFRNPRVNFSRLLFIDQPLPQGRVNPEHEAIHRMGITAVPGGRLLTLDGLHPGGKVRKLAPTRPGSFWRPDLSYDGKRVLFCFKPNDEKSFHLYEMNLDGTGLRQLTRGDYDDVDPVYLPDGHILFTSTRGNSHVRCGPFIYSYVLARCDADGRNVYLISCNGEPDFVPSLMDDGRVIYSRWEYSDKPLWRIQSLWTTGQDGTGTRAFWGNQSVWPDHLSEPRQIPGSRRVMFSGVGHHDWWSGSIGIVDPGKGLNFPDGLTKVTRDLRWPECSIPPIDPGESEDYHASGAYTGYKNPYPLGDKDFLVSARGEGGKFRLYLMDVDGNRELIYEGVHNIWHAMPVMARRPPARQPDSVAWPGTGAERRPSKPGVFFSSNVTEGVPDLPRGSVKYLRVFQLDYKTYTTWAKTYRHSGPAVSIVQEEGVKRILSEVPVESDGSVSFEAPAGKSLFFQLLDKDRRCLQTMRSFAGLMPGERRGCVGCHETHSAASAVTKGRALRRTPSPVTPPPWGRESISFERFVQPVLDRRCGACHQGTGSARRVLDLTLRPGVNVFKEPYLTLVGPAGWGNPAGGNTPGYGIAGAIPVESMDPTMNDPKALATLRPGTYLSANSRLVDIAATGRHYNVKADPVELRRLMAWVDACCPFMGEPELRALGDPDFPGIETLPIRPRVKTAPEVQRP